ncbi:hypothetical protein NEOLI_003057 [Neolecta irregularis DAH-3]|uniref:Uncharacterized protein n=1 Tax=Neolecta irregularis (strain DAH-3) TaxID=1198029 RepID=A0A1U7LPL8_NEOID|nr:hypothetical protein NEOLI_003057 [Neolecta irregularis DAH-3]|eukprot:OLL24597.1 hypothetical protein NEOLI_003057 [Neolecta irregularis DAH-3]
MTMHRLVQHRPMIRQTPVVAGATDTHGHQQGVHVGTHHNLSNETTDPSTMDKIKGGMKKMEENITNNPGKVKD